MTTGNESRRLLRVRRNCRNKMSGYRFLRSLRDEEAKLAIFDPQYRGLMDKMAFGNEGDRQIERAKLPQMTDEDITIFVEQIERVLKQSGHLLFWLDKFSVASGHHLRYFSRASKLQTVDMIHWNKLSFGMGHRSRHVSEFLLIVQKKPIRAKGCWADNGIRDSWAESTDKRIHPHAKPSALMERLIRATTKAGDLVIDPAAGGYGILEICKLTKREFAGCDLVTEEDE